MRIPAAEQQAEVAMTANLTTATTMVMTTSLFDSDGRDSADDASSTLSSRSIDHDQRWMAGSTAPLSDTMVRPRGTGMTICGCRQIST